MTPEQLHPYQKTTVNFQCSRPYSAIWQDMGLGKSIATLTSAEHLLRSGFLRGVLIVAPIRVCRLVWRQEALKWDHTKHLTFSMIMGTKDQRVSALLRKADFYVINYENLRWLSETLQTYFISKGKEIPFDGVVWDEVAKMKNSATHRVRSIRKILPQFKWATGLTGTPASNGYKDLHGQFLVLDGGERLGSSKTAFRERFYYKQGPYKEVAYADTEETIKNLIGDITLQMSAEDYNPLPDLIVNDIQLELPPNIRAQYDALEKEFFVQLDNGKAVEVFNQASMMNKCLQFSNGAYYPVAGLPAWEPLHDVKLDALEDIIDEAAGQQILCSYAYRSDAERIMTRFKKLRPINLTACKTEKTLNNAMDRWAAGDCPLMIGHAACLHPRTQVLTENRGWVRLIDVEHTERVFDGVEFVTHCGVSYSGHRPVMDLFGFTMTPDHKLLIDGEWWVEAKHVDTSEETKRAAIYRGEIPDSSPGSVSTVWAEPCGPSSELHETQQGWSNFLSQLFRNPSHVLHPNLSDLVRDKEPESRERESKDSQKLPRSGHKYLRGLASVREFLSGHARRVSGWLDHRTSGCERPLPQRELCLDINVSSTGEQTHQSPGDLSRRRHSPSRTVQTFRFQQNDVNYEIESRYDRRPSRRGCSELTVRKRTESQKESDVYDLVNCGPRSRFAIKNDAGEIFISHNSMGHGVDRLQNTGHILCWFGLTWSLDLYDQFNARLRRQGQGAPVICHRLIMGNTLDLAQEMALTDKASNQTALRKAVDGYRRSREG